MLQPDAISTYVDEAMRLWDADRLPAASQRTAIAEDLHRVEADILALEQQLLAGAPWQLIAEMMATRRQRRDQLRGELAQAEAHEKVGAELTGPALRAALNAQLADWQALTTAAPADARTLLTRLLAGQRITFRPVPPDGKGCEITGTVSVVTLLVPGSRYVVGWLVARQESAALAKILLGESCARQQIAPDQLTIHADRGPAMTSQPVALLLATLGVVPSRIPGPTSPTTTRSRKPSSRPSSTGRTSRPGSAPTRTPRRSAGGSSP